MRTIVFLGLISCAALAPACSGDEDSSQTTGALMSGTPSILVDLDPNSTGTSVTIESITADANGVLYTSDRETGNVLRVDPRNAVPSVVGKLADRTDPMSGMVQKANGAGLVVNARGDLLIASGTFGEVLRLPAAELGANPTATATTFITGVQGANSVLLEGDELFVSGGATGNVYRAPAGGGAAETWARIEPSSRSVAPDGYMQAVVANGLARDPRGALLVADTARAALWSIPVNTDGSAGTPQLVVQSPLLNGIDGLAYDPRGRLWAAVNERNALVVLKDGAVQEAFKNGNAGPLEFPAALVFIGSSGYVANFDRARADNFADDGVSSAAGIGSSIAQLHL